MAVAFCVTEKSLRDRIQNDGIDPADGAGFYLMPEAPEFDEDQFDLWELEHFADLQPGTFEILREPIPPHLLTLASEASFRL